MEWGDRGGGGGEGVDPLLFLSSKITKSQIPYVRGGGGCCEPNF